MGFVQIGVTALRAPDGKPLPAVPMYIKTSDVPAVVTTDSLGDIPALFADKFKAYAEAAK